MPGANDPNFYSMACTYIQNNKHNQVTSAYYLILKKIERESGRNYVFEQVQREKKKYLHSAGNISTVNFGSPAQSNSQNKISVAPKIMMNQTTVGFNRAGPQISGKNSDGKIIKTDYSSIPNNQALKFLDQIEKIYSKRTEVTTASGTSNQQQHSSLPRPTTDSISSYTNNMQINSLVSNEHRYS